MRYFLLVAAASVSLLAACATHIDGVAAYGAFWLVSPDDIRAAVAARRRTHVASPPIHHIQVISRDEIRVYDTPAGIECTYDVVQRINGTWQVTALVIQSARPI
jgi:hypothetical protein